MAVRDEIIAVSLREISVEVPEWGQRILLREMTGLERAAYFESIKPFENNATGGVKSMCMIVIHSARDMMGVLIFKPEDFDLLTQKSFRAIKRISDAVQKLNGFGEEALETAEKNSEPTQSESLPID